MRSTLLYTIAAVHCATAVTVLRRTPWVSTPTRPRTSQTQHRVARVQMSESTMAPATDLDNAFAPGYMAKGEDWSYAKNSERKDRPLTNEQLKVLTAKSDAEGFKQLLSQYLQIFAAAAVISKGVALGGAAGLVLQVLGSFVMGFGMVTMGHCAQHECIHNTAFATKQYNSIVSWLVSLPRLTNPVWERMLHKDHHTYTNDPARDPELLAGSPHNAMPGDFQSYVTKILRIGGGKFGLGVWSSRLAVLIFGAQGKIVGYSGFDPVPDTKAAFVRNDIANSCRLQLAFYAAVVAAIAATNSWVALARYWALPMLLGEPCHAFFHIADHLNCEHDHKNGRGNTRTTGAPAFVRFNLWNMNYHAEHHLYPSIPFHKLPAAAKALNGHFDRSCPSALAMHRQLLSRWIPHFRSRAQLGVEKVEAEWVPCSPDCK